jgi:prephenate dehydratase
MDVITTVGFQGKLGAYSESACIRLYGPDIELKAYPQFEDVFQAVKSGEIDCGVLPVENSTTGSIHENFDHLLNYNIPIVGEVKLRIQHSLLAAPGISLAQLTGVRSHPQGLAQCSDFFIKNPQIESIPYFDTAGSAEQCSHEKGTIGAIASALAAEEYGLSILQENLQNQSDTNLTRFLAVSYKEVMIEGDNFKTSIVFLPTENRSGVLIEALKFFADRNINLLKIESRPQLGSPWQYIFYLDLEGSLDNANIQGALNELRAADIETYVLGSYLVGGTHQLIHARKRSL